MKIYIIIPAFNEEENIGKTLLSLVNQTLLPEKLLVVNDNSSDSTSDVVAEFIKDYPFVSIISSLGEGAHAPGSKIINAFNIGYASLDEEYDIICKFDADLVFPENYLEKIADAFKEDPTVGIAGGYCTILKDERWVLENLTGKDHVRGALKAYGKGCFLAIGKLKPAMGWDTVDELQAQFHGWKVETIPDLYVQHLKPTGSSYNKKARYKQGTAFYRLRYGVGLSLIASAKLAYKKRDIEFFINCVKGYISAKTAQTDFLVSEEEGRFIRNLRWKNIIKKIF